MSHRDKALPRIHNSSQNKKNTSQNPKHLPESKNTFQNPKHFPESKKRPRIQNTSQNPKVFLGSIRILECVFGFWDVFWFITRVFGFSDRSVLDSGKCFGRWDVFWILRSVFGFWTCFEFWTCFWNLGSVSDFVKSFWILGRALDSGKCFWILGRVFSLRATVCLWLVEENIFRRMICQKYYPDLGSGKTSVWNSCARSSEVMRGETMWWRGGVAKRRLHSQSRSDHWFKLMGFYFFLEYS